MMAKVNIVDWFNRFRKPLNKWFAKRGAGGDSEDLTQEVFIRLIRFAETIDVDKPEAYVFTMAHNIAAERSERCRIRSPHSSEWLQDLVDFNTPDENKIKEDLTSLVNDLINKLPDRQRQIIKLFIYERLKYREIAEKLNISQRMVLRELVRAYTQLRAWLGPILSEVIDCECASERIPIDGNDRSDDSCSETASAANDVRAKRA